MEKRLILAIALSLFIVVTFQYIAGRPAPRQAPERGGLQERTAPAKEAELKAVAPTERRAPETESELETGKYLLTFSNIGGALKRVRLKEFKRFGSPEPLDLVEIGNPKEYIFSLNDYSGRIPPAITPYEIKKTKDSISYSLKSDGLEILKRYAFHNSKYIIELQLFIRNDSAAQKELGYEIIGGAGIVEPELQDRRFIEVMSNVDGKTMNFKRPKDGRITNPGIVGWTALKNRYFSIILKPFGQTAEQFYYMEKDDSPVDGIAMQPFTIPAGSFIEHKFLLYIGPSKESVLKECGFGFEDSLNYGFFGGISKILLSLLWVCHLISRNWGLSVILLSLVLNIILFPLTLKSFKAMRKMQELHPQMEKLKAQCKDNPQKLNKEMMELYKKNNINPFSGCLPMLLQMPIFIALYNGLIRSIDLKGAHFLWIKDLSVPDAVKLPFTLPLIGGSINILPLLMVIGMVFQQKISTKTMGAAVTEEQKQQQKMMLIIMPVMFGFIFYNMPSGLVLYWLVNTILTIVEQSIIFKHS